MGAGAPRHAASGAPGSRRARPASPDRRSRPSACHRRQQRVRHLLAELDAELVERVDAPSTACRYTLCSYSASSMPSVSGRQRIEQDHRARPIAGVRRVRVARCPARSRSASACASRFASTRAWFRACVWSACDDADEIGRARCRCPDAAPGRSVLRVRAHVAPHHRHGALRDARAFRRDRFAEAFHRQLLQVTPAAAEIIVVRQHAHALAGPSALRFHTPVSASHGRGFRDGAVQEVIVHLRRAGSSARNPGMPMRERDRQTDRGPHRIAAADPIPHRQDACWRECRTPPRASTFALTASRRVSSPSQSRTMPPLSSVSCVPKVFDTSDGRGALRIEPGEHALCGGRRRWAGNAARSGRHRRRQRIDGEPRAEIGAADADVDDVGDAGVSCSCVDHAAHACERRLRFGVRDRARPRRIAQRRCATPCAARRGLRSALTRSPSNNRAAQSGNCAVSASANNASMRGVVEALAREIGVERTHAEREVRRRGAGACTACGSACRPGARRARAGRRSAA